MIRKLTTVVVVEAIEPALATWTGLGFAAVAEVPHDGRLGFVILARDGVELMLQTRASVREDLGFEPPALALYADVAALDEARAAAVAGGAQVVIARRTTDYGATECWVRDPSGTLIGLSTRS